MTHDDACRLALRMAFDTASTQPDPCVANWTDADEGSYSTIWLTPDVFVAAF